MAVKRDPITFDDILVRIGDFGRYQICIYNLLCLFTFIAPWHALAVVFLSGKPDHWCRIPEWDSVECSDFGLNSSQECSLLKKEVGIPSNFTSEGEVVFEQCLRYNVTGIPFSPDLDLEGTATIPCDDGWVYDVDKSTSTINQDFNLVCGSSYLTSLSQSIYFAGTGVGSLLVGFVADRIGRKKTLYMCLTVACSCGIVLAFSVNMWMFITIRFFMGGAIMGSVTGAFILANEFIGSSKRNVGGSCIWVYFATGYMCLALFAYFIRNWRHLQLFISLVPLAMYLAYRIIPESARWLLSRNRIAEAKKIIITMAKCNGREMTESLAEECDYVTSEKREQESKQTFMELMRRPRLRMYTFNLMFGLIVNTIVYYGLSLSSSSFGVNIYVAFVLTGAVEIPAVLIMIYPLEYWGRRSPYVVSMLVSGVACVATAFIPPGIVRATVAIFGKFAICCSFCVIFLHACEIFPTPVRNSAFGVCRLGSNLSNIFCPMILVLADVWAPLPLIIFGTMSLLAGLLAILLPETRGKKLPETMDEGENIGWRGIPRSKSVGKRSTKEFVPLPDKEEAI